MATKTIDLDKLDPNNEKDRAVLFGLGVQLEVWSDGGWWYAATNLSHLSTHICDRKFRLKPITRTITIPQCLTEEPLDGAIVWIVANGCKSGYDMIIWNGCDKSVLSLENGYIFASEEAVRDFVDVMRSGK